MKAPRRPFPSFSFAMSGPLDSTCSRVPLEQPSQVFRHPPHPKSCRLADLGDPAMRTVDERFSEPTLNQTSHVSIAPTCDIKQDADSSAVIHLHDAIHHTAGNDRRSGSGARRLSMTTLVIDLALAVKRKLSNLHSSRAR
ncbi:hypothetical protein FIBSPDRAFT_1042053 [Athelia psychrophila]|uniref:Uncharacterized protein n=1 Tax=Athelia psychrophila TaxID=1759441 RepID=A0A166N2S6_9AGAM|nr:hypothetical protein FIBSPDRAFT_1042053 [Fibularhizoctonia sp. CBS 109695]